MGPLTNAALATHAPERLPSVHFAYATLQGRDLGVQARAAALDLRNATRAIELGVISPVVAYVVSCGRTDTVVRVNGPPSTSS